MFTVLLHGAVMKREMYLFLHPPVLVFFILLTLLLKEFDPITLPEVIQLEELSVNSGHLSNSSICVLISFVTSLQWICCFFLGEGTGVDHKIHIVSFPSRPFDIFDDS